MSNEDAHARWNRKWRRLYAERYEENGRRHQDAFDYAWEKMRETDGEQPPAPPSLVGLGFRFFWLTKVKGMDWKKLGIAAGGALLGGAAAALAAAAADGVVTGAEWYAVLAAGVAALGLYLKDPNAHRGRDVRANGNRGVISRTFRK